MIGQQGSFTAMAGARDRAHLPTALADAWKLVVYRCLAKSHLVNVGRPVNPRNRVPGSVTHSCRGRRAD